MFELKKAGDRVDKSDAKNVQVIHTCAGTLGMGISIGTSDFYANDGRHQPGCGLNLLGTEHTTEYSIINTLQLKKYYFHAFCASVCVYVFVKNECYETQGFAHICVATNCTLNQLRIRKAFSAHVQMVQQHTWAVLSSILSKFYFTTVIDRLWSFMHFRGIRRMRRTQINNGQYML